MTWVVIKGDKIEVPRVEIRFEIILGGEVLSDRAHLTWYNFSVTQNFLTQNVQKNNNDPLHLYSLSNE